MRKEKNQRMDKNLIDQILKDIGLEHIEDYYEEEE